MACIALMVLYYFDFEPFYSAVICVLILILFNIPALPAVQTITATFISGGATMLGNMIPMILPGAVLAEIYTKTGAATSLANAISGLIEKLFKNSFRGKLHAALLTIEIISIILMLGGLNGFVTMFATYPIVLSLLRKLNLPRRYMPALVFGLATSAMQMVPGSPQLYNAIANVLVKAATGVDVTAAESMVPGLVGAAIMLVLSYIYMFIILMREHKKGNGYEPGLGELPLEENTKTGVKTPLFALIPLIFVFCMYNFLNLNLGITCTFAFIIATGRLKSLPIRRYPKNS